MGPSKQLRQMVDHSSKLPPFWLPHLHITTSSRKIQPKHFTFYENHKPSPKRSPNLFSWFKIDIQVSLAGIAFKPLRKVKRVLYQVHTLFTERPFKNLFVFFILWIKLNGQVSIRFFLIRSRKSIDKFSPKSGEKAISDITHSDVYDYFYLLQ